MTIATTSNKVIGQGNAATTNWPFSFIIPDAASLVVLYTDTAGLISTITAGQYSVAGLNDPNGGSVTYPLSGPPIAVGTTLTVLRTVAYNQQRSVKNQGGFFPDVYEAALDYLTMQTQQINEILGRAIVASSGDLNPVMGLPAAAVRANSALGFDAAGNIAILNKNTAIPVFSPSVWMVSNQAALKALSGMAGNVTAQTQGSVAAGDGGAALFFWNPADVTADNGSTVIAPNAGGAGRWNIIGFLQAGAGAVARTVASKQREVISVFDFMTPAQIADVQARTALVDVTAALNAAFAAGAKKMPAGKYKITNTLWGVPEGSVFQSCHIVGDGMDATSGTVIDASALLTKPAINLQRVRDAYIGHLSIIGGMTRIDTSIAIADLLYTAGYVSAGLRDSRYSPQCGICIDGGVGPIPPDGGYAGFVYQGSASGSHGVTLDNVRVQQCVVGVMHNPENGALGGDMVEIRDCDLGNCKVPLASGQSQARCITVTGGQLGWCRTCYDGLEYGTRNGASPIFKGVQYGPAFEMFATQDHVGALTVIGGRAESVHRIGETGGLATSLFPTSFNGLEVSLLTSAALPSGRCPLVWESSAGLGWVGGSLDAAGTAADAFAFVADPAVFTNVMFRMINRFRPFIGCKPDLSNPASLKNCRVIDGAGGLIYGEEARRLSLPARVSEHATPSERRMSDQIRYNYVPFASNNYVNIGVLSNIVFSAAQLVFDNTDAAGGLCVGDVILWQFKTIGKSVTQYIFPAVKITAIAAPTVTCSLLYPRAYYDEAYLSGNTTKVLRHFWAPGTALTGDTHTNTTLDNVNPTTILQDGDWITAAAGIPANTRVKSGGGTAAIVLSRAATDTAAGKTLYWDRLNTYTQTPAF